MASVSVPNRKRTPDSNADDANVSTPKRTCNNEDYVNDQKEKMAKLLKDNPASALALSKLLSCDACKSFARAPIRYCNKCHTICSLCYTKEGAKCPAEGCKDKLQDIDVVNAEMTETIRAMKLPVQCRNRKTGCLEKGEEREVEEHEIECEFRITGCGKMFKDHLFIVNKSVKVIGNGKWQFGPVVTNNKYAWVFRDSIEPDGTMFSIYLGFEKSLFKAYAQVIGGERVAKNYRVELKLSSSEKEFTHTHYGPVFSADVGKPWNREETYIIDKKRFALFNNGFDYFGDHNKDKNGEIIVPIMVKIIKKELDIPQEDIGTPVDMGNREK